MGHELLIPKQELRVTPDEPRILAPLSKIRELKPAANTGWTGLLTFCGGAIISAGPDALGAIADLFASPQRVPSREALYQLFLFLPASCFAILSGWFVFRRSGQFELILEELKKGRRFRWNEATGTTTPLEPLPAQELSKQPFWAFWERRSG